MDRVIGDGMKRSGIPGLAVDVVSGRRMVHAKSFTALAAMQLVDAGKLELDAPTRRYAPELRLADQPAADRVTVRQALQQTTGLPATAGGPIVKSAAEGSAIEALTELRDTKLATAPGAAFKYSNANFILAGLIVERASGVPYAQYIRRHIFVPLGHAPQLPLSACCASVRRTSRRSAASGPETASPPA